MRFVDWARSQGAEIDLGADPERAASGADCIITDTWVSMNQEHKARGHNVFLPYQVNEELDGQRPTRMRCSCIACPPTAARKSPTRLWMDRNRWCSMRPKTACMRKRRSCAGAWAFCRGALRETMAERRTNAYMRLFDTQPNACARTACRGNVAPDCRAPNSRE
jgi:hypothetical protein